MNSDLAAQRASKSSVALDRSELTSGNEARRDPERIDRDKQGYECL